MLALGRMCSGKMMAVFFFFFNRHYQNICESYLFFFKDGEFGWHRGGRTSFGKGRWLQGLGNEKQPQDAWVPGLFRFRLQPGERGPQTSGYMSPRSLQVQVEPSERESCKLQGIPSGEVWERWGVSFLVCYLVLFWHCGFFFPASGS